MTLPLDQQRLIDGWQRGLPLVTRPFASIAAALDLAEADVISMLRELQDEGILSRVGATVRPNSVGASLLAAISVAPNRLEEVAATISADPSVNHNYEREHAINLWFVVTAPCTTTLRSALGRLRAASRHDILELPLERAYYLDLGFPVGGSGRPAARPGLRAAVKPTVAVEAADRRMLAALEDGLALVERPYLALGRASGLGESDVIVRLERLISSGIISRLGLIVRHRALGIDCNAMAVWDVDDRVVDEVGARLAAEPCVTLCYRRPRRLPDWPYNLFCMVHGRDRDAVRAEVAGLGDTAGLGGRGHAVLFSRRCFVQRGARFKAA
jgi:DNA-binding Lrp family transcriptional regulator